MFALAVTPEQPGTLLDAELVDPSLGLEIVEKGLVQSGEVANGESYPPKHPLTELPAKFSEGTFVAFALVANDTGNFDGLGVVLIWTSGGSRHIAYQATGVRLCVDIADCNIEPVTPKIADLDVDSVIERYS